MAKKNTKIELKDLKVLDVIKMPLFFKNVETELKSIWNSREKARNSLSANVRLKSHPIDSLHEMGLLEPGEFIVEFVKVLDKVSNGLSSAQRDTIHTLGMTAFNNTMKKLISNEEKGKKRNGNNNK